MDFLLWGPKIVILGGPNSHHWPVILGFIRDLDLEIRGQIWIFALPRGEGAKFCKIFEKWAFFAPYDFRQPPRVAQKKHEKSRFFLLQALSNWNFPNKNTTSLARFLCLNLDGGGFLRKLVS